MPDYPWEKLRATFPGKYENPVDPVPDPDEWFHVKVVVNGKRVSVYVNNASRASLDIEKLSKAPNGGLALWVGNNSGGSFANFSISPTSPDGSANIKTTVPYGNNPTAGKYFDTGDGRIYYEVYGQGKPLVMLHGGLYGYISEFEQFIPKLAENYQVICIATRGHGKSDIGKAPFTYKQRAEDAFQVIRNITQDSVIVFGFSDGGNSGYKLASLYPAVVKRLIVIGASGGHKTKAPRFNYSSTTLMKQDSSFFASRLALMAEPNRWPEVLSKLNKLYNDDNIGTETFSKIKCPVLVMTGDRDQYNKLEEVLRCARDINKVQLSVIPGCAHVVFFCNFPAVLDAILPFLK
jgi:pimeloyl-ACP methyl ester carboxylesterase